MDDAGLVCHSCRSRVIMASELVIVGPVIQSRSEDVLDIIPEATITVRNGIITEFKRETAEVPPGAIVLKEGQFLCPGLIDIHIHAPQYPNMGLGSDLTLLDWLNTYTFPLEVKYSDVSFANSIYRRAVDSSLSRGTTTACYHATISTESSVKLAKILLKKGQRAIVGKVAMNQNCPKNYCEETDISVKETELFLNAAASFSHNSNFKVPLVLPAVTPRFAIACDSELLAKLGALAKKSNAYIQTHISENLDEISFCKDLFPDCKDYTDVYVKAGLLSERTILAHGVHLSDSELERIKKSGACIAHCPSSNTFLRSGVCDVRRLWNFGINVGLGSDVSGGNSASIVDVMRAALSASVFLSFSQKDYVPLTYREAFYLATLGGAKALHWDNFIGTLEVGKEFDALIVDMDPMRSGNCTGLMEAHSLDEMLQKFIYCSDSRNISKVFVRGRLVHETSQ